MSVAFDDQGEMVPKRGSAELVWFDVLGTEENSIVELPDVVEVKHAWVTAHLGPDAAEDTEAG